MGAISNSFDEQEVHLHLQILLNGMVSQGEFGTISRNDGVLLALFKLIGSNLGGRNIHYFSTPDSTIPDFTGLYDNVQLIIAEEKDGSIKEAVSDIINKFRFSGCYKNDIEFMFGFAFSRDEFRIIEMMRGLQLDIPIANSIWFSSSSTFPTDRLNCIFATLNARRILRFYRLSDFLDSFRWRKLLAYISSAQSLPETPMELQTAILDILRCIKYLNALNYFHTDIRWTNIVYYTNSWYLIDCREFCHMIFALKESDASTNQAKGKLPMI
eukprot:gene14235-19100_t